MTSSHLSVVASLLIAGSAWAAEPAAVEGIAPLHPSAPVQTVGQELDFTLGMDGLAQDEDEDEDMDFGEEEEESSVAEERSAQVMGTGAAFWCHQAPVTEAEVEVSQGSAHCSEHDSGGNNYGRETPFCGHFS